MRLVVVRPQPLRWDSSAPADPPTGLIASGPNSSKANVRSRSCSRSYSMRASFCSLSGSGDSFHVLVRWNVIFSSARIWRSRSRPTCTLRPFFVREVVGELADRPMREGPTQLTWSLLGRLDDERSVSRRDLAGPATRPLRVQRSHMRIEKGLQRGRGLCRPRGGFVILGAIHTGDRGGHYFFTGKSHHRGWTRPRPTCHS